MKPLHQGDSLTQSWVTHIASGVLARSLPKSEWTHCAHLVAGTVLVTERGLVGAEAVMPEIIRQYNLATGVQNSDTDGYHHTITLCYLRAVDSFLTHMSDQDITVKAQAVLAAPVAAPSYLLKFYSQETLFSVAARRGWVAPDLTVPDWAASG